MNALSQSEKEVTNLAPWCGRPAIECSHDAKPSWKTYGDGRALLNLHKGYNNGIEIKASEYDRDTERTREVYHSLSPFQTKQLVKWIVRNWPEEVRAAFNQPEQP